MNPLICSPAPRDIYEFRREQNTIGCDKLIVKYHHATRAYKIMRSYFLDHEEYTHMIIHPDDLIANKCHYDILKQNIEEYDFQVLSGVCNVSVIDDTHLAVSITDLPRPQRRLRNYNFAPTDIDMTGIIRIAWAGTPFMWIRRDVLEKIELEDDSRLNPQYEPNQGWAFDIMFCYNCKQLDIPIYVNMGVVMKHLKDDNTIAGCSIKTGIAKPQITLVQGEDNKETDVTDYCHNKYLTTEDWKPYYFRDYRTGRCEMI